MGETGLTRRVQTVTLPLVALLVGLSGAGVALARQLGSDASGPAAAAAAVGSAGRTQGPATAPLGRPLGIRLPAIDAEARLMPLGLNPDGTLEVPPYELAGWYSGGALPGQVGPAVIAAHLDSTTGPAVFYRLADLEPGDLVHVDYRNSVVTFRVRSTLTVDKAQFPTSLVYGKTRTPELRLVTCDGAFDKHEGAYDSNLIVWADLVGDTP